MNERNESGSEAKTRLRVNPAVDFGIGEWYNIRIRRVLYHPSFLEDDMARSRRFGPLLIAMMYAWLVWSGLWLLRLWTGVPPISSYSPAGYPISWMGILVDACAVAMAMWLSMWLKVRMSRSAFHRELPWTDQWMLSFSVGISHGFSWYVGPWLVICILAILHATLEPFIFVTNWIFRITGLSKYRANVSSKRDQ